MAYGLDLGNLLVHLRADASQFTRTLNTAEKRLKAVSDKLTSMGRKMTMRVTVPIATIGAMATKSFASFDDAMTKSLAIMSDVTPAMRKEMEKLATTISKRSVTSATQLAKSYFFLASAGLSAEQSIAALATVERFAVAGAFDMALATDLVTDAQSALGLTVEDAQKNLENMMRITDVLTGANTLANASTQQFSEALMRAGPAMKAFGIEAEGGVAVLAAFADQGKKGAEGGELFSRMLRLMIKGFLDSREAWDRFKISIVDADDKMRPMADIVRDLTNLLGGMGVTQKASTLAMLGFQARSQQAIMPLLGMGDAIELYNEKLLLMKGITQDIYEKQLKSFSSQMKIVWNNVVDVARQIGEILAPHVLKLNELVLKATGFWDSLNDSVKQNVILYAAVAAAIGPVLLATGFLFKALAFMVGTLRILKVGFVLLGAAISAPLVAVLALASIAYVLRAAWTQNLEDIKARMQEWFDAFEEGFAWLETSVIGKFITYLYNSFAEVLRNISVGYKDFIADIAGLTAGIWAFLKETGFRKGAEAFAVAYSGAFEKVQGKMIVFEDLVVKAGKRIPFAIKAAGIATAEHLERLMDAVKTQFGKDADAIINLIKSKIKSLQTPIDELREASEAAFGEKMLMDEVTRAVEAIQKATERTTEAMSEGVEMIKRMLAELDMEYNLLGKINEARERAIRLEKFRDLLTKEYKDDLETINELMTVYADKLDKLSRGKRGFAAFTVQMREWADEATNVFQNVGELAVQTFDDMARSLSTMLMRGKVDFKAFARSVVGDLIAIIIRAQMAQVAMSIFPGLFAAPVAAAPSVNPTAQATMARYQHGGIAWEPQVAMVAEKEPELITPLSQLKNLFGGTSNAAPTIIINNQSGTKLQDPTSDFDGEKWVVNIVANNIQNQGLLSDIING